MKTPINELLEYLETHGITNEDVHLKIDQLLEKEKQMIIDAYLRARRIANNEMGEDIRDSKKFAEQYYNETFK